MKQAWILFIVAGTLLGAERGAVVFESSDQRLRTGFDWAKKQALAYVFTGDPVGNWYEASLPGRDAFCMRDVSHQSTGAQVLGLAAFTRNMLSKFASNIAESRDWCTYWEIDKSGHPASVDYKNDRDFWYNLPANFDLLACCYRQYLWTGDPVYLRGPEFQNFYRRTVRDYVARWDKDRDGIPESYTSYGHRGIGSYDEDLDRHVLAGADLLAAEAAAFRAYSAIADIRGDSAEAAEYRRKAGSLTRLYNDRWWNPATSRFYRAMLQDRTFYDAGNGAISELWFGIAEPGAKLERSLDAVSASNVETSSYLPEIAYRYGRDDAGYKFVLQLTDPSLKRREYPEVSYAVVGAVAQGLMGITPDARHRTIETRSHLTVETAWASIANVPVFDNEITVRHDGKRESRFTNQRGPSVQWKAAFPGRRKVLLVDGKRRQAAPSLTPEGAQQSAVTVEVKPGATHTVRLPTGARP